MQDDIKPPDQQNLPPVPDNQPVTPPAPPAPLAEPPNQSPQPTDQPQNNPVPSEPAPQPPNPALPKPPEHKEEHNLVPIVLAIVILLLLGAVAIVSGNR